MTKTSKYFHVSCGYCGQRIRMGKVFVLSPEETVGKVPQPYHAQCYEQTRKRG